MQCDDPNISIADCHDGSEEEEVPAGSDYIGQGRVGAGRGETAATSYHTGNRSRSGNKLGNKLGSRKTV